MPELLTVDTFYENGRKGKLIGLECDSNHMTVPPRKSCLVCRSQNLKLVELSGRGKIISFTEVHVKSKEFPIATPYDLALVQLVEGGNLLGVLEKAPGTAIQHGGNVWVKFRDVDNAKGRWPRIFFETDSQTSQ
jgi:uncharacterized OB-fold protein